MQSVCSDHCLINEFNLAASKKPLNILELFGLLHLCQVSDQLMRGYPDHFEEYRASQGIIFEEYKKLCSETQKIKDDELSLLQLLRKKKECFINEDLFKGEQKDIRPYDKRITMNKEKEKKLTVFTESTLFENRYLMQYYFDKLAQVKRDIIITEIKRDCLLIYNIKNKIYTEIEELNACKSQYLDLKINLEKERCPIACESSEVLSTQSVILKELWLKINEDIDKMIEKCDALETPLTPFMKFDLDYLEIQSDHVIWQLDLIELKKNQLVFLARLALNDARDQLDQQRKKAYAIAIALNIEDAISQVQTLRAEFNVCDKSLSAQISAARQARAEALGAYELELGINDHGVRLEEIKAQRDNISKESYNLKLAKEVNQQKMRERAVNDGPQRMAKIAVQKQELAYSAARLPLTVAEYKLRQLKKEVKNTTQSITFYSCGIESESGSVINMVNGESIVMPG
ncbi:MAG: hypothetical protein NTV32_08420 [Gammaproteobacteria bacterium]|nr:hypothetical protein [Gammaproteobacteria bacterium]